MARRLAYAMLVLVALYGVSCTPADPRRVVAEDFIDRLFVVIDQASARDLATGLAVEKLDEEIRLRGDQQIDESTRKPRVTYRFVASRGDPQEEASSLIYQLRVAPDGADSFTRRLILTLRRDGDRWRVGNYTLETPIGSD
jgi:hypothetical protein